MRVSRIYRLLRLVNLLQGSRGFNAHELAEELQVSRRTVFRDLNALELARIPYYYEPSTRSYRISQHFFLPPVNLTFGEAMAILTLAGRLEKESNIPLLSEGARAAAKIEGILPAPIREHLGSVMDRLSVRLAPLAKHDSLNGEFDQLAGAIIRKRICRMKYQSLFEGKLLDILVHPLRLAFHGRAWYLLAWTPSEKALRTYKLIRIQTLTVTDRAFRAPKKDTWEEHFSGAWNMIPEGKMHKIHLHFAPKVAENVAEVQWHATQDIQRNADGSIEFRAKIDGLGEITWWILGYGDQVKVCAPKALAMRVAGVSAAAAAQYSDLGEK